MEITRTRPSLYGEIAHGLGFWTDRSAVHEAAAQGRVLQLKQLIEGGAAVNIVSVDSITPLHEACIQGQTQCVRLLLDAGAQVDARNIDGSTPLCDACAAGSLDCVKLLLDYGATVNPPLFTFSPLHEACMGGNSACVQLMIDSGAFMEAHDCHYGTPLHVACARQHYECAKVLLIAGANVNAAKLHETALHHAAKAKNITLIELLVEFGGNVFARDNLNKKPIHYTSVGSPSFVCLQFYENNPLSLQQLSRVAFRRSLGHKAQDAVPELGLPKRHSICRASVNNQKFALEFWNGLLKQSKHPPTSHHPSVYTFSHWLRAPHNSSLTLLVQQKWQTILELSSPTVLIQIPAQTSKTKTNVDLQYLSKTGLLRMERSRRLVARPVYFLCNRYDLFFDGTFSSTAYSQ